VKFNELIADCAIYSTVLDITDAANGLAAEGHVVEPDDLASVSPLITRTIRGFGDWHLDLTPPKDVAATRLDLAPGALFPTAPA
jgi:Tn3 transposase DDE domain